ncbi:exodeoxyribonuclease V subunit alpha [Leptospira ilyithenensis]|uniref:RecBCD enzyme subunit RecD n=1 Tax=Leptospira ilyithenensis TaxID=2484901 RepID=A0A4R9LT70_9LEPT|nr:exodeoxyribonuclease V subunit alpha [Leptospira ilyithenensis]TGN11936.1 exodeoxyribonuclease V subunit alpha [Leptospira ilyithenensis]
MKTFVSKLKEDLQNLKHSSGSAEGQEPSLFGSADFEAILTELWLSEEEGNLCVPVKKEWEDILKSKPEGLILESKGKEKLLYFEKTFKTKKALEEKLKERIAASTKLKLDEGRIVSFLEKSEGKAGAIRLKEGQKDAIFATIRSSFQIISGGPGTGKTTVVAYLLAILKELGLLPATERIALVAPTGRAAQRLTESIRENLNKIDSAKDDLLRGQTIHSLLAYKHYLGGFYYNKDRYLPHELIIVDEVSMVDLNLMRALLEALPGQKQKPIRLILIGDPNQLPSVDKGAVLGDFLSVLEEKGKFVSKLTESNRQKLGKNGRISKITELADFILKNESFDSKKPVSVEKDLEKTDEIGESVSYSSEVVWFQNKNGSDNGSRDEILLQVWKQYLFPQVKRISEWKIENHTEIKEKSLYDRFSLELKKFRCLTTFRSGYWGVDGIQEKLSFLAQLELKSQTKNVPGFIYKKHLAERLYYSGLPILVTENDRNRKLFNGDIGLVLKLGEELRAVFPIDNELYHFALDTLPKHEAAYVLTVHKSQGSEYETVFFYLPDKLKMDSNEKANRLLNRQILYTGLTRAKEQVILAGSTSSWDFGIGNSTRRLTGFQI